MSPMTLLGLGSMAFGAAFLASLIRAARFAARHGHRLGTLGERLGWLPLLLFRADAFGIEAEAQRRRHRSAVLSFGALFFGTAAAVFALAQ